MNKSDLTKILKNCPKGTKLYTTVWGEVTFNRINNSKPLYPILIETCMGYIELTKEGYYTNGTDVECVLFPSKEQRDWSKFTAPWYKKENNTIEQSQTNEHTWFHLVSDVLTWKDGIGQYLDNPEVQELAKKLCSKYAQKLYNPSILSNSLSTGKDKQKFNPKTLKPFDKILVCDDLDDIWRASIFSHIYDNKSIVTTSSIWLYGIPYNEETKHLVGTTGEAPEYYRYWED